MDAEDDRPAAIDAMEEDEEDERSEPAFMPARRGGSGTMLPMKQQQQGQGEQPAAEVEEGGGGWSDSDDSDGGLDGGLAGFERRVRLFLNCAWDTVSARSV
jgi:hypothetical protein